MADAHTAGQVDPTSSGLDRGGAKSLHCKAPTESKLQTKNKDGSTKARNSIRPLNLKSAFPPFFGAAKGEALHTLDDEILSVVEQPAQILREIPEVYIYQDVIS